MLLLTLGEYCVLETSPLGNLPQSSQLELSSPSSECSSIPIIILSMQRCEINKADVHLPYYTADGKALFRAFSCPWPRTAPRTQHTSAKVNGNNDNFLIVHFQNSVQSFLRVRDKL